MNVHRERTARSGRGYSGQARKSADLIRRANHLKITLVGCLFALACHGQEADSPPPSPARLLSADEILDALLTRLPTNAVTISGDLISSGGSSGQKSKLHVSMLFSLGPARDMARYTIADAFGRELEQVTVTRKRGVPPQIEYARGCPLTAAPAPNLLDAIQDTAAGWLDLTLSFLWWRNGKVIGRQEVKGQPCYVLDLHSPAGTSNNYASVRLWVDTRVLMLLQAEGFSKTGDLVRRIAVKSFKKINDQWMVKDLEIQDIAAERRTILRVRDVEAGTDQTQHPAL